PSLDLHDDPLRIGCELLAGPDYHSVVAAIATLPGQAIKSIAGASQAAAPLMSGFPYSRAEVIVLPKGRTIRCSACQNRPGAEAIAPLCMNPVKTPWRRSAVLVTP